MSSKKQQNSGKQTSKNNIRNQKKEYLEHNKDPDEESEKEDEEEVKDSWDTSEDSDDNQEMITKIWSRHFWSKTLVDFFQMNIVCYAKCVCENRQYQ